MHFENSSLVIVFLKHIQIIISIITEILPVCLPISFVLKFISYLGYNCVIQMDGNLICKLHT